MASKGQGIPKLKLLIPFLPFSICKCHARLQMLKFSTQLMKAADRTFCLFYFLGLLFSPMAIAAVQTSEVNPKTTSFVLAKTYEGFQDEVEGCDFTSTEGWFYWYIDSSDLCTTVMVANEQEAMRLSSEILEYSFDVVKSGYGANF